MNGAPRMRRRSDPEASRAAILAAARRCFSAKGLSGTSMSDIASAASVTQSLIHHHFGSKESLWRQVLDETFAEYAAQQKAQMAVEGHPRGLVRKSMAAYFRFLAQNPEMLRLMAWAELEGAAPRSEIMAQLRASAVARFELGQRAGLIRDDVPAEHILTVFQGLARTWFQERNLVIDEANAEATEQTGEAYLQAAWTLFAGGILAEEHRNRRQGPPP